MDTQNSLPMILLPFLQPLKWNGISKRLLKIYD